MAYNFQQLPHPGIRNLSPYIPGKSIEKLAQEQGLSDIIKLASNENALGTSPKVHETLANLASQQIAAYPDPMSHPLRQKIAEKHRVDAEMITLANGSDALFPLIMQCFALHCDKEILVHDYSFIPYRIYAQSLGIPYASTAVDENWEVSLQDLLAACHEKTAVIFLANPNNPTGTYTPLKEIKTLLTHIPESILFVLDEAYFEYAHMNEPLNSLDLLQMFPNLVITRTFSKAYGLAGLRIGYAISHPDIASILIRAMEPFAINQAGLFAAQSALDDDAFIADTVEMNVQGIAQLKQGLKALNIPYIEPAGNFITINCQRDAGDIYQKLLHHGIIVRPLHPYGMDNYLRVTSGTSEQNKRFLDTLPICL